MSYGKEGKISKQAMQELADKSKRVIAKEKARTLAEANGGDIAQHVAQVVHHGASITLPEGMSIPQAIETLHERLEYFEKQVTMTEELDVFPYDGALALECVLKDKFGWSQATGTPQWWGEIPPVLQNVQTGPDTFVRVPWGSFAIMGVDGSISVGIGMKDSGRYVFQMTASIKRKDEATLQDIFKRVREHLKVNSIYRGKAIKIKFKDDDGDRLSMPTPEFIDVDKIDESQLIYNDDVYDAVDTNLFTPIRRVHDLIANGIPVKRGVLLGGTFGVGKTLGAMVAAKVAVESGVTYIYIPKASELAEALEFAKQYSVPACVVFCEDVDREMSGERDETIDEVLNLIDGIDTKNHNIITVATTNELEKVEKAMLRPGRFDAVIEITTPNAKTAARLLRHYGGDTIDADTVLDEAGELLAGYNAAVVSEVVQRAKLSQLRLNEPGQRVSKLSQSALVEASRTMKTQLDLSKVDRPVTMAGGTFESIIAGIVETQNAEVTDKVDEIGHSIKSVVNDISKMMRRIGV